MLGDQTLCDIPTIMQCLGGLDLERRDFRYLEQELEHFFVFLRGKIFFHRTACAHRKEQTPHSGLDIRHLLGDIPESRKIAACDRGVNLCL